MMTALAPGPSAVPLKRDFDLCTVPPIFGLLTTRSYSMQWKLSTCRAQASILSCGRWTPHLLRPCVR